ncbi:hypothetical protein M404DRAFT_999946 [Pisolithus tinctorius Marx 270]|uniref:Uncharacterized protein n=1 Tax=Pisolithus tinctorius Marx 270 TaxID=870435 RepID=A0A0C3K6Y9_PISTI|nr:hypothetical protein M404DRAFT_999946 [Pisolithus tinctorius Marx 270]
MSKSSTGIFGFSRRAASSAIAPSNNFLFPVSCAKEKENQFLTWWTLGRGFVDWIILPGDRMFKMQAVIRAAREARLHSMMNIVAELNTSLTVNLEVKTPRRRYRWFAAAD